MELSKQERVKESLNILNKLVNLGIPKTDLGYTGTKAVLDQWISDGQTRNEQVFFPRAKRIAHMFLPSLTSQKITYVLKATEALKDELSTQETMD